MVFVVSGQPRDMAATSGIMLYESWGARSSVFQHKAANCQQNRLWGLRSLLCS